MAGEKLMIAANYNSTTTKFSCARYGNVLGSRGSVVELFEAQIPTGIVTVTEPSMTRFWLTLKQGTEFVKSCIEHMQGGEIFIPNPPASTVKTLVEAMAPECKIKIVGPRPGEKLHEVLVSETETTYADCLWWQSGVILRPPPQKDSDEMILTAPLYSNTARQLTVEELRTLLKETAL
jgi:FlaA1/EpsC-like NDP-sugar epimerase